MADQDIEIKVDELPEVEIKVDAAGDAKGAAPGRVPAELGVDDLKRQVDEARLQAERERNARAEAERRAQQNEQQVRRYAGEVQDSQYHIIANAIDATQKESAAIKRDYAEALERGDYAVAADLQERLSDARHRLGTLQQGRDALEMQRQAPPRTEGRVEQPRQPAAPPTSIRASRCRDRRSVSRCRHRISWSRPTAPRGDWTRPSRGRRRSPRTA